MGNNTVVNPGMYPMQNMSYIYQMGGMMDDIYGRQLYYQMNNGQTPYTVSQTTGTQSSSSGTTTQNPQASAQAGGIKPMWPALGIGAATYLAGTNLDFIKPVDKDGKLTEEYLKHFSGEYAAEQNGKVMEGFYKATGKGVNAQNFESLMKDVEKLGLENDPAKISEAAKSNPLLKSFLEEQRIIDKDCKIITQDPFGRIRAEYTNRKMWFHEFSTANNYSVQSQMLEKFNGLKGEWAKCGNAEAKLKLLKDNAHILGIEDDVLKELHFNPNGFSEQRLNSLFNSCATDARGTVLKDAVNATKNGMHNAGVWEKGAKWFNRGSFKGATEGMTKAMNTGLKSLRKSKFIPIALIATAVTWGIGKLCK